MDTIKIFSIMERQYILIRFFSLFFTLETTLIISIIFMISQTYATLGFDNQFDSNLYVYNRIWFELIMILLTINLIGIIFKYKTYRKVPILLLHFSIILILLGAGVTRYFGEEGILHLRIYQSSNFIILNNDKKHNEIKKNIKEIKIEDSYKNRVKRDNNRNFLIEKKIIDMGFTIRLDKFKMDKYPGTQQASSYESFVTIIDGNKTFSYHIYMNHILQYKGFRIYQMGYDPDEKGTILFVNRDKGFYITYLGYFLFCIGFILTIFYKNSRFQEVRNQLKKSGVFSFFLILLSFQTYSYSMDFNEFSKKSKLVSDEFAKILVQSNGRIKPMDSLNMDLIYKISRKDKLHNMDYNQLVIGILSYPELFEKLPIIYVGNKIIREKLNIESQYAPYYKFFDKNGNFKFSNEINSAIQTPDSRRDKIQREWLKLNERISIFYMIYNAQIFSIFPYENSKNENYKWYSIIDIEKMNIETKNYYFSIFDDLIYSLEMFDIEKLKIVENKIFELQKQYSYPLIPSKFKIDMEIKYNHLKIFYYLMFLYFIFGIIAILIGFIKILKNIEIHKFYSVLIIVTYSLFFIHTGNIILRFYISGYFPWTNAYESMIFIAWTTLFSSLIFLRRNILLLGAGLLVASIFMMVAHLNNIDPQITNLIPILKSYWLLIHVVVVTLSYGFLGVAGMLGFLNIILFGLRKYKNIDEEIKNLNNIIYLLLYIGLGFLSIGTFLGGVWANESWGSYWSWDVKESWSLITIVAYGIIIHTKLIPSMKGEILFSFLSFLTFSFVLMTYFGVNFYIAQGLHSYGRGEASYFWFNLLKIGVFIWFFVVILSLFIGIKKKREKNV